MQNRNRLFASAFLLGIACLIVLPGCGTMTLAPGGVYTDPVLAAADQAILDGVHAMSDFLTWNDANRAVLVKYQEVGALAAVVRSKKDAWEKDAWAARDAYASATKAYKQAIAAGTAADPAGMTSAHTKLDAAIAVLTDITNQYLAYKAAHPTA